MEAGLVEIVLSVNRSWVDDANFSLYRPVHPGGKVRGECPHTDSLNHVVLGNTLLRDIGLPVGCIIIIEFPESPAHEILVYDNSVTVFSRKCFHLKFNIACMCLRTRTTNITHSRVSY